MRSLLFCLILTLPLSAEMKVDDLSWMAGHWVGSAGDSTMEELWLAPSGGVMLGMHRDVKGARTSFEFFRIAATPEGIVYFAQPGGKPPTPFTLIEVSATRAVFANPQHDFPKRIIYELRNKRLCARVEGDGEAAEEWCWNRR
ncbi:MAG: DUF6265 family protein [Acidobacteriota bacterium]